MGSAQAATVETTIIDAQGSPVAKRKGPTKATRKANLSKARKRFKETQKVKSELLRRFESEGSGHVLAIPGLTGEMQASLAEGGVLARDALHLPPTLENLLSLLWSASLGLHELSKSQIEATKQLTQLYRSGISAKAQMDSTKALSGAIEGLYKALKK